jgi:acetylornithine deacetylase/succinyl-diaminopimelate desuccinylase-like protein
MRPFAAALLLASVAGASLAGVSPAQAQTPAPPYTKALRPDQTAFRGLYKELVETNTTLSAGSCTLAEERMAARLKAAGYTDADLTFVPAPGKPKEGSLVARLNGSDPKARPILLLAHIDVVEAKREDWTRDPFVLVEEDGYFWARGASDDKAMASIWVDTLIRLKQEGYTPKRTIKMALTCGEETSGAFNGAENLSTQHRDLIDAAFALNEGGGGLMTEDGHKLFNGLQAGEKTSQNYRLETTNPGGHSSIPRAENAIYVLAAALTKIGDYSFPIQSSETTRSMFAAMGKLVGGDVGAAQVAFAKNPADAAAIAVLKTDPNSNAVLHTTCVATMVDAGHATNALAQRAAANVNCRIWPGVSAEAVKAELERVVADPRVKISVPEVRGPSAKAPPLSPEVMGPLKAVSEKHFPGVPVVPTLLAAATDGQFLGNADIPTYGVSGIFQTRENNGIHGLNERVAVRSLYEGRDFLFDLVKAYAPR